MDKLPMTPAGGAARIIETLAELFPSVVAEALDDDGNLRRMVDFDALRQELSAHLVEGPKERYRLDWPGKRRAALAANTPIARTLRPRRGESVDFDSTRNLIIEGDNLEVLKLLQESYLGRVKLIYIDPPYNTGRDFIYDDDYAESSSDYLQRSGQSDDLRGRMVANSETGGRYHSNWLSMMYPRLRLARNLLKDDGAIFISIDDHEVAGLRALCDEVFGAQNFVAQIIWQKVYSPKNSAQWFSEDHDYILCYARNKALWQPNQLPRTPEMEARYKNPDNDPRGPWKAENMTARNPYDAGVYSVSTPSGRVISGPPKGTYWRISKARLEELDADNRIWWGADGNNTPAVKRFLSEVSSGRTPQTLWSYKEVGHTQDAKKTLLKYVPFQHTENVLNSVKPVQLIQRILQLATVADDEDIVLDFFSGSGTTAHAVLQQNFEDGGNRRFVAVQVHEPLPTPEPEFSSILGMSLARLKNVAAELEQSAEPGNPHDSGFRVLAVDTSNFHDVSVAPEATAQAELTGLESSSKSDRTGEDLLFQVLLDWGLEPTLPIRKETIDGFEVHDVEEGVLMFCHRQREVTGSLSLSLSLSLSRAAEAIARRQPLRAVFCDADFTDDAERINVEQIFQELSPHTEVKTL